MPSKKLEITAYILGFAAIVTALLAGFEYFEIESNNGTIVAQLFLEGGLCAYICQSLCNAKAFVKEHPKTVSTIMMRYALWIGLPTVLMPLITTLFFLGLGNAELLASGNGVLVLLVIAGLVYVLTAMAFGMSLPGSLTIPKEPIRKVLQRSGRQWPYLFSRFFIIMVPFGIIGVAVPLLSGIFGVTSPDNFLAPQSLAIIFLGRVLTGVSLLGFCIAVVSAYRFDIEEQGS
ncbi:hypothetical protein [Labrenzia sp. CE80]|uniref:hypothetical protein n=1 Tax=Labrenzia sp. CE80 TaxID=1788986 RepID=UPI00129A42FA|nr:hypothetical protein [Labrenzia sp. CE80]